MQNTNMQTSHKKDLRFMDTPNKNEIILRMIRTHFKQCTANDVDFLKMTIKRCASNKNGQ